MTWQENDHEQRLDQWIDTDQPGSSYSMLESLVIEDRGSQGIIFHIAWHYLLRAALCAWELLQRSGTVQ